MPQPLLRCTSIIVQAVVAMLCIFAMPAQARSGHYAHEHKAAKASGGACLGQGNAMVTAAPYRAGMECSLNAGLALKF
jgi:hypothetical protein